MSEELKSINWNERVLTTRSKILEVCKRWRESYPVGYPEKDAIYAKLSALNLETATADEIHAIIGNSSWTDIHCSNCDRYVDVAVTLGEFPPDYETATANVCIQCLHQARAATGVQTPADRLAEAYDTFERINSVLTESHFHSPEHKAARAEDEEKHPTLALDAALSAYRASRAAAKGGANG